VRDKGCKNQRRRPHAFTKARTFQKERGIEWFKENRKCRSVGEYECHTPKKGRGVERAHDFIKIPFKCVTWGRKGRRD